MYSTFLSLALLLPAQCPQAVVEESIEEINFPGPITSREERSFKLPDGRIMKVPVINGYLPEIGERRTADGVIHRKFTFDTMTKYNGQTMYGKEPLPKTSFDRTLPPQLPPVPITKPPCECVPQPDPSKSIDDANKAIDDLRKQLKALEEQIRAKDTVSPSRMKRPSEIKDPEEGSKIIPKY